MAHAMWKGVISLGLVAIPVSMYNAIASTGVNLHYLHKKCLTRPKQIRYCEQDNEYFGLDGTVKGYEVSRDRFVIVKDSDLKKVPVKTLHTIAIACFVESREIDPTYHRSTYYLLPDELGARPFSLLLQALGKTNRLAIAKVTFQNREHPCYLRPVEGAIILHTLHYHDEIVPLDRMPVLPGGGRPDRRGVRHGGLTDQQHDPAFSA